MAVRIPMRAQARAASQPACPPPTTTTSYELSDIATIVAGQSTLRVLVIGGGGREHALAWRLRHSPSVTDVQAAPGNPGSATVATCHPGPKTPQDYVALAEHMGVDLTVVGPEALLVQGIVDLFRKHGMSIVGPTMGNAALEGSKVHAKNFMNELGVPTARYETVANAEAARDAFKRFAFPLVLKTDGLAAGKGVIIATTREEADAALAALAFPMVIEEFLEGEEVTFIALCDGKRAVALEPSQDHKRVFDDDQGPNTGGMGAYSDSRLLTPAERSHILDKIVNPVVHAISYTGFLYAGLMMTPDGPSVLEFNVRLGDPETQPLMMRLESDWGEVLMAAARRSLPAADLKWSPDPATCVVLASGGYPGPFLTGNPISGLDDVQEAVVFHAGTKRQGHQIVTAGGRVLGVTATGPTLRDSIDRAYAAVRQIHFEGMHYRKDIGAKGLKRYNNTGLGT
jgi:phosphoribosylamine--glycine ligase